jgi:acetoin utilization deacetylase AcuC-like enzyme
MPVYFDEDFLRHKQTAWHPERPERLVRVLQMMQEQELDVQLMPVEPAAREQLTRVHDDSYLSMMEHFGEGPYDPDTYVRPETYGIAEKAAGASVAAALDTLRNDRSNLVLARPPGHHSGRNYAGGFCYMNNIAIAARALQAEEGVTRVAILDFDVHHGNGTSDIFYLDDSVLYISTHQWGIYPGTGHAESVGEGTGEGFNINIPLRGGMGDATLDDAMERGVRPAVEQFTPKAVLVSLGGDGHYADPLGGLTMSSPGYVEAYLLGHRMAREMGLGGATYFLEGGYDLDALAEVVWGVHEGFSGRSMEYQLTDVRDASAEGSDIVDNVVRIHRDYWDL